MGDELTPFFPDLNRVFNVLGHFASLLMLNGLLYFHDTQNVSSSQNH
jgi:hypothetical protein